MDQPRNEAVPRRSIQLAGIDLSKENLIKNILPEISTPNRIQTHKKVSKDAQASSNNQDHSYLQNKSKKQIQIDSKSPMQILVQAP